MDLTEKTLESHVLYEGKIIRVRKDTALLPNGNQAPREVVEHPGGVGIVPLDSDGCVLMVRQFRYPLGKTLLEIPAGKMEPGEDPQVCAERELSEEAGASARQADLSGLRLCLPRLL